MLKKKLHNFLFNINNPFLIKAIIFESNPDYCDNTYYVYKECLRRKLNMKYKFIWFVQNPSEFDDIKEKNVYFYNRNDKFKFNFYRTFAKYIIDCNKYVRKRSKNQFRIHLTHGATIKVTTEYCRKCKDTDYVLTVGDHFVDIMKYLYNLDDSKVLTCGFPRTDVLGTDDIIHLFPEIKREKTIIWCPTYRNHISHNEKNNKYKYGVPCIKNQNDLERLNTKLKYEKTLLLLKLHPAENTKVLESIKLSNIRLVSNDDLKPNHGNVYQLLNDCDALITDYSSLYYDFLITKKNIAIAAPDLKEFAKNNELLYKVEDYKDSVVGDYINNVDDLIKFVEDVHNNKDRTYKQRMEKIKQYFNYPLDHKASSRIVDILVSHMNGEK